MTREIALGWLLVLGPASVALSMIAVLVHKLCQELLGAAPEVEARIESELEQESEPKVEHVVRPEPAARRTNGAVPEPEAERGGERKEETERVPTPALADLALVDGYARIPGFAVVVARVDESGKCPLWN